MHWIPLLFARLRIFSLSPLLRKPLDKRRSGTISNYKLLTHKKLTNRRSDFKASKYFDIRNNSWKLDKLVPSVLEANKLCKEIFDKKL